MSDLYKTLQALCDKRNLKFTALAKKAGISPGILYDLKNGRKQTITLPTAQKVAHALGVDASVLTGKHNEKNPTQGDITLDEIEFALFGEVHELTEEDKLELLRDARRMRELSELKKKQKNQN